MEAVVERFDLNLVPVAVDLGSDGLPAAVIWNDGHKFRVSSFGSCVPFPARSGKPLAANVQDIYISVGGNRTVRRSLVCDEGDWFIVSLR